MDNLEKNPVKLYIQDIYRSKRKTENKYIYEMFGLTFKNIMIHGVVTNFINTNGRIVFELSDPTGCVQVYYNSLNSNTRIKDNNFKDLVRNFAKVSKQSDNNVLTMSLLLNSIEKKYKTPIDFQEGSYLSVIGDIFVDDIKKTRMVSAYSCKSTSAERDIIWMEELRYLYDKYYIRTESTEA